MKPRIPGTRILCKCEGLRATVPFGKFSSRSSAWNYESDCQFAELVRSAMGAVVGDLPAVMPSSWAIHSSSCPRRRIANTSRCLGVARTSSSRHSSRFSTSANALLHIRMRITGTFSSRAGSRTSQAAGSYLSRAPREPLPIEQPRWQDWQRPPRWPPCAWMHPTSRASATQCSVRWPLQVSTCAASQPQQSEANV